MPRFWETDVFILLVLQLKYVLFLFLLSLFFILTLFFYFVFYFTLFLFHYLFASPPVLFIISFLLCLLPPFHFVHHLPFYSIHNLPSISFVTSLFIPPITSLSIYPSLPFHFTLLHSIGYFLSIPFITSFQNFFLPIPLYRSFPFYLMIHLPFHSIFYLFSFHS
jgi:hypothetical protein